MTYQYFNYLGTMMNDAGYKIEIKSRIIMATTAFNMKNKKKKKKKIVVHKNPTNKLYNTLTPLYSRYKLLHVTALEGPSLRSTDTFCEQGHKLRVQM